jgi:hypothetical protein
VFVLEAKGIPLLETWLKDVSTSKGRVRSYGTPALVHPDTPCLSETSPEFHNAVARRLWKSGYL